MFKSILKTSVAASVLLLTACGNDPQQSTMRTDTTAPVLGSWGVDLTARKDSIKPGDDFFRYANGTWLDTNEIPGDRTSYGLFNNLRDRTQEQMKAIIDDLATMETIRGSAEEQVANYFASWMDVNAINQLGIEPLRPDLNRIAAISDVAGLIQAFGYTAYDGGNSPISVGQDIDRRDPNKYTIDIGLGGMGLPDRDFYLEGGQFEKLRAGYKSNIIQMLGFAGIDGADTKADAIIALETKLAELQWPRADRRNSDKTLNPSTVAALSAEHTNFNWASLFEAAGIKGLTDVNVSHPNLIAPLVALINDTPLEEWKAYLSYHLIRNNANLLSDEINSANFEFWGKALGGQPAQQPRWKRGTRLVGAREGLGEALGQIYVTRFFPDSAKQQMMDLVENLRTAYGERIDSLSWMSDETKKRAHAKLAAFRPKIGYPDEWLDLSAIEIKKDDLFGNARRVAKFFTDRGNAQLNGPTDKDEWFITPHTVNAFYNPSFNEILFPAAFLQAPFFDPSADPAVNYGAIGMVIGHEMGHGFDDQGSKFDADGVQRNWWSDEDRTAFEARTKVLGAQYDTYEPVKGHFVDGNFTMGENIGDLGGAEVAYHAYRLSLKGKEAPIVDGLTGDQRFFLGLAQVSRGKVREQALIQRLKADPHAPAEFRTNGVVRNMEAWYKAFDVKEGDALYLAPEKRVSIW